MIKRLRGEHILVVGFGYRTGLQTANFLLNNGVKVSISDVKSETELADLKEQLVDSPVDFFTGKQEAKQLDNIDRIILSPGVPRAIPLIQEAIKRNIPVWSEIELAYRAIPEGVKIVGITGTDGKSTTASLTYELLKTTYTTYLGGNIGIPFISFVPELKANDVVVLELSSYQLEDNETFKCDVACILNISEDHLDRYPSLDAYIDAKENILRSQDKANIAILNEDSSYYERHKQYVQGKLVSFSRKKISDSFIDCNNIIYNKDTIIPINLIKLQGLHNLENVLCSVIIARELGVSIDDIQSVLKEFSGLSHRTEYVDTINGIDFIDDSKATTINSVKKAIESQQKPVILLLGGRDKGLDFSKLDDLIDEKAKDVVLFGESRDKIAGQIKNGNSYIQIEDFIEAVKHAYEIAKSGDVVLLSPGCTSWDQFSSYAERGDVFKKIVEELK